MSAALFIHIVGGSLGLIAGAMAVSVKKGDSLHRKSGLVFVFSMLTMSLTGAGVAAYTAVETSVVAGLLTAYLVYTAWTTVRPPASRFLLHGPTAVGLLVGVAAIIFGVESSMRGESMRDGMPTFMLFVFGLICMLASASDIRIARRGPLQGARRLVRHLWRMCVALYIASASFFLGQTKVIPEPLRIMPILILLALAPLFIMLYWLWRVRFKKKTSAALGLGSVVR